MAEKPSSAKALQGRPNWYNKLSRTKRKRVILANKRKRQKMTDSEREVARAKWRKQKRKQRCYIGKPEEHGKSHECI